jgi:hypothetical protein
METQQSEVNFHNVYEKVKYKYKNNKHFRQQLLLKKELL